MRSFLPCVAFAILPLIPFSAYAQADKGKQAVIDPALADADFAIQGEFEGTIFRPAFGVQNLGLQVVALGGGKFEGVLFRGGLPGAGWDGTGRLKLAASDEDPLVLASGSVRIALASQAARVRDAQGNQLGRLAKVQRVSPTMGAPAPRGAVVLFDGRLSDQLVGGKLAADGTLLAGLLTKMPVHDFRLHLEFRTPYMPFARGQGRGNSGVYIQQRYEVQILDSFGLEGVENECGGLYKQTRPDVNMCLPPLSWQTYDIWFTAARWSIDGKTKEANARIIVLHNGVPIHWRREIAAKTGGGKAEGPQDFPINLQDHGNPVTFRNIWLVPGEREVDPPAVPTATSVEPRRRRLLDHLRCR